MFGLVLILKGPLDLNVFVDRTYSYGYEHNMLDIILNERVLLCIYFLVHTYSFTLYSQPSSEQAISVYRNNIKTMVGGPGGLFGLVIFPNGCT